LSLLAVIVNGQPLPGLRPPAQAYIYDFKGSDVAAAPVNLGASFTIEFWLMPDRDAVANQL
jgi:hypothetical protein